MKTFAIDRMSTVKATSHGQTYSFEHWTEIATLQAGRAGKALRKAERELLTDKERGKVSLRARLITGQFTYANHHRTRSNGGRV